MRLTQKFNKNNLKIVVIYLILQKHRLLNKEYPPKYDFVHIIMKIVMNWQTTKNQEVIQLS